MDRFDSMTAFARVIELGSFTKAADSLHLPKTTLSAQIAALERRLGIRLLHRTTRSVSATPEGAAYYERVVGLLADLAEVEASASSARVEPHGRLRIDMPPAVGHRIVIPALGDFVERYPRIVLEVGCTDRPVDLVAEGVDCVLRGNLIHDEGLVARRLGAFEIATCASPAYLARHGCPATPEELDAHLVCRLFSARIRGFFDCNFIRDGVRHDVKGRHVTAYNDIESALAGALAALGIVQLPRYILDESIAAGRLVPILGDYRSEPVPIHLLYPQQRLLSAKVKAFASWVQALFAATRHVIAQE